MILVKGLIPFDGKNNNKEVNLHNTKVLNGFCKTWMQEGGILQFEEPTLIEGTDFGTTYYFDFDPDFERSERPKDSKIKAIIYARAQNDVQKPIINKNFRLKGMGATLKFPIDGDYTCFMIGGFEKKEETEPRWNEHGSLVIEDITFSGPGPDNNGAFLRNTIDLACTGLSVENAQNMRVVIENVKCENFMINFHLDTIWSLSMRDCLSKSGFFSLWVDQDVNSALYENCQFIQGWYGIILIPGSGRDITSNTFNSCRFETLRRFGVINPPQKNSNIRGITINDPYVENWGEPLCIGKNINLKDNQTSEDLSEGNIKDIRIKGGFWAEPKNKKSPYELPINLDRKKLTGLKFDFPDNFNEFNR